jgi:hypothetical protein
VAFRAGTEAGPYKPTPSVAFHAARNATEGVPYRIGVPRSRYTYASTSATAWYSAAGTS